MADARAAVAWYTDVFGFVAHVRIGEGHRSQLRLPDGPTAELVWWPRSDPDDGRQSE